jgi:galactose mutarotase-like enzyme
VSGPAPITLQTGALEVVCDPARGFAIDALRDRASGAEALWRRPGHAPAAAVRALGGAGEASVPTFLDAFTGGWFVMFPEVGYPAGDDDASFLHGEVVRLPWEVLDASERHVTARVQTLRRPLTLERTLSVEGAALRVRERIANVGGADVPYAWGHHPCFARETFAGGRIELAPSAAEVPAPAHEPDHAVLAPGRAFTWPRAPRADGGAEDLATVPAARDGRVDHACLTAPAGTFRISAPRYGRALRVRYDAAQFPYILLWQDFGPPGGFPLWGGGDTFALEFSTIPGRSTPDAIGAGALRTLAPGASAETEIELAWEDGRSADRGWLQQKSGVLPPHRG